MGLIQYIKNKIGNYKYAVMLSGRMPIFSQFGDNIYSSDIVQSIIDCIVAEMSKLNPQHIRRVGRDVQPENDSIQHVLNWPNELMTRSDFMSKIIWNLLLNYNSIIYPVYETYTSNGVEKKRYTALYPLQPSKIEMLQDDGGQLFIRMTFKNQSILTLPYEEVIHIRYKYSFNEYLGGNAQGQPDNDALLKLLTMNDNLTESILVGLKTSYKIDGFIKAPGYMGEDEKKEMKAEFERQFNDNKSGLITIDPKADFIPVNKKVQLIDPDTLKFIDERIVRTFGVSLPIITGDYTKEQLEAFYQKKLEPLIIAISQAFTKTLFTTREKQVGHEIVFMPKALMFLNTTQTIEAIKELGAAGDLFENEKRVALGLEPLEELNGIRMQSLNYINTEIAAQYQLSGQKPITEGEGNNE